MKEIGDLEKTYEKFRSKGSWVHSSLPYFCEIMVIFLFKNFCMDKISVKVLRMYTQGTLRRFDERIEYDI